MALYLAMRHWSCYCAVKSGDSVSSPKSITRVSSGSGNGSKWNQPSTADNMGRDASLKLGAGTKIIAAKDGATESRRRTAKS